MMEVIGGLFLPVVALFSILMVLDALSGVFETIAEWIRGQI